ncbi:MULTISPECIES: transcriptional repressor [unclassified Epibacterium]|jgi:Fur family zinc uptake transcriptional regulator|uniref:transcriptional repressor n=1 Tax=unclassified Epibacterium TaxID=2639179 RepID=UPI001EF42BE6|nr:MULTISPECIES: transcriptional repressor [unclassified Epibacterium]MCG7625406.1 transcriptional repressor [Epibacterium sp. Ofav1-8]MCG7629380.1 transcriptional repressor [Epibacterium sp. MM17-32]
MDSVGFVSHDHSRCITGGLSAVETYCREKRLQFTPVRRRTLEILLQQHRALGAYEILEYLRDEGLGSQPPVAYRALEFLVKHGFVHKIERLNAFIACMHPGETHTPVFMICRKCDSVAEAQRQPMQGQLGDAARAAGFLIERTVVEAEGLCPRCQD